MKRLFTVYGWNCPGRPYALNLTLVIRHSRQDAGTAIEELRDFPLACHQFPLFLDEKDILFATRILNLNHVIYAVQRLFLKKVADSLLRVYDEDPAIGYECCLEFAQEGADPPFKCEAFCREGVTFIHLGLPYVPIVYRANLSPLNRMSKRVLQGLAALILICILIFITVKIFTSTRDGFVVTAADKAKEAIRKKDTPNIARVVDAPIQVIAPAPLAPRMPDVTPTAVSIPIPVVSPIPLAPKVAEAPKPNPLTTTVKEVGSPVFISAAQTSCPTLSPVAAAAAAAADARVAADTAKAKVTADAASKVIAKNILNETNNTDDIDSEARRLPRNTRYGCNLYDKGDNGESDPLDDISGTGPDCACQDSMPARADSYSRSGKRSGYRFNPEMDE